MPVAVLEDALGLRVDEVDQELDERLALVRHHGARAAHHPPDEADTDDAEQYRDDQRIDVQRPEAALADRLGEERQVMLDVLRRSEFCLGGHYRDFSDRVRKPPSRKSAA